MLLGFCSGNPQLHSEALVPGVCRNVQAEPGPTDGVVQPMLRAGRLRANLRRTLRKSLDQRNTPSMGLGGKIEIRPMMYLALSYDHRIVDGKEAVTFLVRVKEALEDPARLVLDL